MQKQCGGILGVIKNTNQPLEPIAARWAAPAQLFVKCYIQYMKNKSYIVPMLFGFVFVIVGIFVLCATWSLYRIDTKIEREGVRVSAHVSGKSFSHNVNADFVANNYNVEYYFKLQNGTLVYGQYGIAKELWQNLNKGDEITVFYLPENPKRSFPQGYGQTSGSLTTFGSVFALAFLAFGAFIFYVGLHIKSGRNNTVQGQN